MNEIVQNYLDIILNDQNLGNFLCVLGRTSSFLLVIPIFSNGFIPVPLKVLFVALVSFLIVSHVGKVFEGHFFLDVSFQVVIGLIMGFMTRFLYDGIILGLEHRDLPHVYGVQFHPESFLSEEGALMMRNFLGTNCTNIV